MSIRLNVSKRNNAGGGYGQRLRNQGVIPAVVYGKEVGEMPIEINLKDIKGILASEAGRNSLIDLVVDDENSKHTVMVKDIQRHPVKGDYLHLDLHQISLDQKIHAKVLVHLTGEPAGVKKGGVLQLGQREIEIECLPTEIPEQLEVDISDLDFGESVTLEQILMNSNVKVTSDPQTVLATIVAPRLEPVDDTSAVSEPKAANDMATGNA